MKGIVNFWMFENTGHAILSVVLRSPFICKLAPDHISRARENPSEINISSVKEDLGCMNFFQNMFWPFSFLYQMLLFLQIDLNFPCFQYVAKLTC